MKDRRRLNITMVFAILFLFLIACSVVFIEPTPTPVPTSTPIPPTLTPSPIPPTCTPTPIPLDILLMGEWEFEDASDQYIFAFNDGILTISVDGESIEARYTVDFSQEPYHMDWISEDGEVTLIIFEFVDEDTLHMFGSNPGEQRPTAYGEDTIILKRVTESE